ncbi:hypothetical protein DFJ58DRAFT_836721 [Suillus subalutaceus]|uniref:uncharacterized protein n=1 Tax=Suillus subalutaceus TaxID=48586 RepID=UPI001B862135|nr:uncharacterized protein DFJ58DRAFT_836721 [Suillus subalutaceus]KAG1873772.1 hypothetical protein DFJ58DRAFT_836721 [Suillus subalutaceus]
MHTEREILKTEHQRRMEMKKTHEQRLKGRFIVNYWDESDADPISVTGYEKSTVCSLSDHHDLLRALSPNLGDVEYYDTKLCRWILDNWDRPLEVTTNTQVFICRRGVVCKDLGNLLQNYQDGVGNTTKESEMRKMCEAREGESAKGENAQRTGMVVRAVDKCRETIIWCNGSEPNRERSKDAKYGLIMKRDTPRNWLDDGWMLLDDVQWSALKCEKRAKRVCGNAKCESESCALYAQMTGDIAEVAYGVGRQVREKHAKRVQECCALCGKVARLWRVLRESCALCVERLET